jgi:hypothetical protein
MKRTQRAWIIGSMIEPLLIFGGLVLLLVLSIKIPYKFSSILEVAFTLFTVCSLIPYLWGLYCIVQSKAGPFHFLLYMLFYWSALVFVYYRTLIWFFGYIEL